MAGTKLSLGGNEGLDLLRLLLDMVLLVVELPVRTTTHTFFLLSLVATLNHQAVLPLVGDRLCDIQSDDRILLI